MDRQLARHLGKDVGRIAGDYANPWRDLYTSRVIWPLQDLNLRRPLHQGAIISWHLVSFAPCHDVTYYLSNRMTSAALRRVYERQVTLSPMISF